MTSTRSGFQRRIAREGGVIHTNEGGKAGQGNAGLGRERWFLNHNKGAGRDAGMKERRKGTCTS
jgi:hypothetical protein